MSGTLSYYRISGQGKKVKFPDDIENPPQRSPFGKNGKGRHALFCFDDKYKVTSFSGNDQFSYIVSKSSDETKLFNIKKEKLKESPQSKKHGLKVSGIVTQNYLTEETVESLIKSKFLFDPLFNIYLNNSKIDLLNLESLKSFDIEIPNKGEVKIYLLDASDNENKSRFKGIAWWVNNRLVGTPDWKNILTGAPYLDKRYSIAKKISFIVKADILED